MTTLYTIGFTRTTAEGFFTRLEGAGVRRLIDVRLHNRSQLAGFAKGADLPFFLDRILGAAYEHRVDLAPTDELLKAYRSGDLPWDAYEREYLALIGDRRVGDGPREAFAEPTALLCSEPTAERCHRRVVAEHLSRSWGGMEIEHL